MKRIIFILMFVALVFSGCTSFMSPKNGEPMACFEARVLFIDNKKNHDKSIVKVLIDECAAGLTYERRKEVHEYCKKKENRNEGQSYDGCRLMLLTGK